MKETPYHRAIRLWEEVGYADAAYDDDPHDINIAENQDHAHYEARDYHFKLAFTTIGPAYARGRERWRKEHPGRLTE